MRTAYFSLDRIPKRSDCEKLLKEYKLGNVLGKGAYGKVFELCKDSDCSYVLKTMEFNKQMYDMIGSPKLERNNILNSWIKEIDNQLKVIECQSSYKFQFVPHVYDAWFCDKKGDTVFYIIMEKFEGDLSQFIKKFSNSNKEVKQLLKSFIMLKLNVLEESLKHINNTCNICLDDIKLENILYKTNEDGTYDLVFSDFGTSIYGKNVSEKCINTDIRRFSMAVTEFIERF
jgi:serine/threonine protein kinase